MKKNLKKSYKNAKKQTSVNYLQKQKKHQQQKETKKQLNDVVWTIYDHPPLQTKFQDISKTFFYRL